MFSALVLQAQIKGVVSDKLSGEAIIGASVFWQIAQRGVTTNADGIFEIALPARVPDNLIISYIGYKADTIKNITSNREVVVRLNTNKELTEVEVTAERAAISVNTIEPFNKISLGKAELKKAACCNLSESFETNATVDVSFSDAVSGTKQIKMLGLEGAYSQFTFEHLSGIRGLSTNYGLGHIPGTWVQAIDITKGIGSVANGYESISGQINIELDKPEKAPRFFLNLYAGDAGRLEANIQAAHRYNKHWSTLLLTHINGTMVSTDYNHDNYWDVPTGYQVNLLNRWKYENPGKLMTSFGVQAMMDDRVGGQKSFKTNSDNENKTAYGVLMNIKHLEGFGKMAIGFNNQPYKSLGINATSRIYQHQATFGVKNYTGTEYTYTGNLLYQSIIGSTDYKFTIGSNFMYDKYAESYNDSAFNRTEIVPGVFGELNYDIPGKTSVLLGVRGDYHNMFGAIFTPRIHFKQHLFKYTVFRASAGKGMHVANVFIENAATLASNRIVSVEEKLKPEIAWNYGTSISHSFKVGSSSTTLLLDIYRTDFENQVVADLYTSAHKISFYNLQGKSYSNSLQTEIIIEPVKKLEFRAAYKYQDVKATYNNNLLEKPLVARDRVLLNASYATKFDKWKLDATYKWFGMQSLPSTNNNELGTRAGNFYTVNAQITRGFKKWELYVGVENLFNYMQHHQIADAKNPFGNNFDASVIWGPTMGRVLYTGLRMTIK